jgi:hypothetical protein
VDAARAFFPPTVDVCPKVLHLDTESDFLQARSSLIATEPEGNARQFDRNRLRSQQNRHAATARR